MGPATLHIHVPSSLTPLPVYLLGVHLAYLLEKIPDCHGSIWCHVYHGIWKVEVKYGGTVLFLVPLSDDLSVAIHTQSVLSAIGITKNLCYDGQ
jgi:hypothetical protein